jgi:arginase
MLGRDVVDQGDLAKVEFQTDPENPRERSRGAVCQVVRAVAAEVRRAASDGAVPLVLGGDCTITIGALAGLVWQTPDVGLMYFDGDLDLNTPATTPSGLFDGMVMGHVLGGGSPELARVGPRCPLVLEENVVFFGFNTGSGFIDPPELAALERSRVMRYALERVREDPLATAREALARLESRVGRILVHFDLDVTDIPAVDVPHQNALPWESAVGILRTFVASPQCAGLVVTEFDPRRDPDGSLGRRLVDGLVEAFRVEFRPVRMR